MPVLAVLYGPLVVASALALATVLFLKSAGEMSIEFQTEWIEEARDENINKFAAAEDVAEAEEGDPRGHVHGGENDKSDDDEPQSPHEILGVPPNATRDQIMAAYRDLIKQYHPDFQQSRGPKLRELAERESQLLNWTKEEALKGC
jgi:DnaJ-domain-containing protein 1